jgi:hypothetical protein
MFAPRLVVLALLSTLIALSAAASSRPKATGNGQVTISGKLRTFAFTAQRMPDGSVKGMGNIQNRSRGNHVKFDIDCLRIEGNTAIMSGIVVATTDPAFEEGPVWFRAIDNGEGRSAASDEMTLVGIYPAGAIAPTCSVDDPFVLGTQTVIEGGNIQVHGVRAE